MSVVDRADINLAALDLSDIYTVIIQPQNTVIPGVSTSKAGIVGSASRGPLNTPIIVGSISDLVRNFGPITTDTNCLVTEATMALKQGANNLICVRVSDTTHASAVGTIRDTAGTPVTLATLTAKSPGVWGNSLKVTVGDGSNSSTGTQTYKVTLEYPGEVKEVFDNIAGTGATLAANVVSAINNGQGGYRGPSNYVTAATAYAGSVGITKETRTFASGVNGSASITKTHLIGVDAISSARTGMYALRETGVRQFILSGLSDTTSWADQFAFAKTIGALAVLTMATGTDTNTYVSTKKDAGIDGYQAAFVKDWIYINDTVNNRPMRLVSPLGLALGRIATLSPEQSPGNKPVYGVIATERTKASIPYSDAELSALESAGVIPVTNPIPAGNTFGLRNGQNASSNASVNGINYTRMTHFLAYSLNAALGQFVCLPHTAQLRRRVKAAISSFLSLLQNLGMIGDPNGGPAYSVICDDTNNPSDQVAAGYLFVTVQVRYLGIARFIVVSLEGGQTVTPKVLEALGGNK